MSFTSEVSAFMDTLGPFYESVDKEEEENQSHLNQNGPKLSNLPLELADKEDNLAENPEVSIQSNRLEEDDLETSEQNDESKHKTFSNHTSAENQEDDSEQGIHDILINIAILDLLVLFIFAIINL